MNFVRSEKDIIENSFYEYMPLLKNKCKHSWWDIHHKNMKEIEKCMSFSWNWGNHGHAIIVCKTSGRISINCIVHKIFLFVLKFLHVCYRLPWYKIYSICIRKIETQTGKKIGRYCWTEIMFHQLIVHVLILTPLYSNTDANDTFNLVCGPILWKRTIFFP